MPTTGEGRGIRENSGDLTDQGCKVIRQLHSKAHRTDDNRTDRNTNPCHQNHGRSLCPVPLEQRFAPFIAVELEFHCKNPRFCKGLQSAPKECCFAIQHSLQKPRESSKGSKEFTRRANLRAHAKMSITYVGLSSLTQAQPGSSCQDRPSSTTFAQRRRVIPKPALSGSKRQCSSKMRSITYAGMQVTTDFTDFTDDICRHQLIRVISAIRGPSLRSHRLPRSQRHPPRRCDPSITKLPKNCLTRSALPRAGRHHVG